MATKTRSRPRHTQADKHYTAIYRVRHGGIEIGQTEQLKGSADITAQLWDRRTHTNEAIGVFRSHKEAEKAIVKEWQRRNTATA
jgi:hypothetical protein